MGHGFSNLSELDIITIISTLKEMSKSLKKIASAIDIEKSEKSQ